MREIASDERGKLEPFLAAMLVATGMIGSGVYLLPASLGAIGSISILGWIGAFVGAALIAGVFSGLARMRPQTSGLFAYVGEAFWPGMGFVVGLLYWIPTTNVPIAVAATGYLSVFLPAVKGGIGATVATLLILWASIGANLIGPRFVARFGGWTLLVGLVPILAIALFGWAVFHPSVFTASWNVSGKAPLAVLPGAVTMIFWAFVGIENASIAAPLIRDPARNVARATFGGLGLATVLYLAASAAIMGIVPAGALAKSSAPFADAARVLVGPSWGGVLGSGIAGLVALCAMVKAWGTLVGGTLVTAETAESEAVLGQILPNRAPRRADQPPTLNLLVLGAIMSAITVLSTSPTIGRQFALVAEVSVVLNLLTYLAAALALLRFALSAPPGLRRLGLAATCVGAALFCCAAIAASEPALLLWTAGAIAAAAGVWAAAKYATPDSRRSRPSPNSPQPD